MSYRVLVIVAAFSVSALSGCGSSKTAPVTGTVTLDGQPVAEASIAFHPKEGGRMSTGETDAQGNFTLTCYERGDGAIPGDHVVTVTKFEESKVKVSEGADELDVEFAASRRRQPKTKWLVPKKYSEKDTSGLSFTVERGGKTADFNLQSK